MVVRFSKADSIIFFWKNVIKDSWQCNGRVSYPCRLYTNQVVANISVLKCNNNLYYWLLPTAKWWRWCFQSCLSVCHSVHRGGMPVQDRSPSASPSLTMQGPLLGYVQACLYGAHTFGKQLGWHSTEMPSCSYYFMNGRWPRIVLQ